MKSYNVDIGCYFFPSADVMCLGKTDSLEVDKDSRIKAVFADLKARRYASWVELQSCRKNQ